MSLLLRFLRRLNYRTWLELGLLCVSLSFIFVGFNEAINKIEDVPWALILLFGLIVGWMLERARLKIPLALISFIIPGIFFIVIYFGRLIEPLFALERSWASTVLLFFKNLLNWATTGFYIPSSIQDQIRNLWPSYASLRLSFGEVSTAVNVLIYHLSRWYEGTQQGEQVADPVAVGLIWSFILWSGTNWAIYATRRYHNPLLGIAPLFLSQAFALNYVHGRSFTLLPVIFTALLATAFSRHFGEESRWQREKKDYADYLTQDTGLTSFLMTTVVVLLAFFASLPPLFTIQDIENFINRFRQNQPGQEAIPARNLGLNPNPEPESRFSGFQQGGLPRQHLLGSGPELSKRVVMNVQVEEELQQNNPTRTYYWRALTYDQYTGHGWSTSKTDDWLYTSRQLILTSSPFRSIPITVRFSTVEDMQGLLYTTGELVSADHAFELALRPVPKPPEVAPEGHTIYPPDIFAARIDARSYRVSSLVPMVSTKALQVASSIYPDWIANRYLALPADLSDRLLGLVLDLTENLPTSYAKTLAIQDYLRTIPYSLDVPAPDPFVDVVDYFLFDLKKGYCDYYATAMVVMTRAIGIPSRLVVGYASGNYDPINHRYVVTEANAHSWVEVYFPGTGWVEFEPTAALPVILRPEEDNLAESAGTIIPSPPSRPELPSLQIILGWGILAFITFGGVILIWNSMETWRLRRLGSVKGLAAIFKQLYRRSRPLTGKPAPGDTPLEFSSSLYGSLDQEFPLPGWKSNLPITLKSLKNLTQLYVQAIYSPHEPSYSDLKLAWQQWKLLRGRIWLARLGQSVPWNKKKSLKTAGLQPSSQEVK